VSDATTAPTGYVYVDCETTGLDRRRHHPYELAWAVDTGPVYTLLLPHTLRYADPAALEVGGYWRRNIPGMLSTRTGRALPGLQQFVDAFDGPHGKRTLVAANPCFDTGMLWGRLIGREPWHTRLRRRLWLPAPPAPVEPWHYRLLDIEAYAAGAFGWEKPRGLSTIRDWLTARRYAIPRPDHSSGGDVATVRACHHAIWDYLGKPYGALAPRLDPAAEPA